MKICAQTCAQELILWVGVSFVSARVFFAYAHINASCVRVYAYIFMTIFVVVHCHLMSLHIKFHKDPTISC